MVNYDMNTGVPAPSRSLEDMGFRGLATSDPDSIGPAQTSYKSVGMDAGEGSGPAQDPSPLQNKIIISADTMKPDIGPSAHDLGGL